MPNTEAGYQALLRIEKQIGELGATQAANTAKISHMEVMSERLAETVTKLAEAFVEVRDEARDYRAARESFWSNSGKAKQWDDGIAENRDAVVNIQRELKDGFAHIDKRLDELYAHIDQRFGAVEGRVGDLETSGKVAAATEEGEQKALAKVAAREKAKKGALYSAVAGIGGAIAWAVEHWDDITRFFGW